MVPIVIRILHTADLQVGKGFHFVADERRRGVLAEKRLEAIDRIKALAEDADEPADAVLIAGDLFDSNTVDERDVVHACAKLGAIPCPVVIIPGNHDHGGAASVFVSVRWRRNVPDNVSVALEPGAIDLLDGRLSVLCAPLTQRHERRPVSDRLNAEMGASAAVRIGLAHGAVKGFDAYKRAIENEVKLDVIERARLDYLALGDWHGTRQETDRAWYAGTPEPDRFKDNDAGHVLRVTIDGPGATPVVEKLATGEIAWCRHEAELLDDGDVAALGEALGKLPANAMLHLTLRGTLSLGAMAELDETLDDARGHLLHVGLYGDGVMADPTDDELNAMATAGYVREAVQLLVAARDGEEDDVATDALRLLYRLRTPPSEGVGAARGASA